MTRRKRCQECGRLGCTITVARKQYFGFNLTLTLVHENTPKAYTVWQADCASCGECRTTSLDHARGDVLAVLPTLVHAENAHAA